MRFRKVPEGSGADAEVRFRKIPVQRLGEVLEGSGAYTQASGEVVEGSGADT